MQIIDIKGKKWVVGLEWEILPDDKSHKIAAKDSATKTNNSFGIIVNYDDQYAIGLSKKSVKAPSAALYLALANQEARNNAPEHEYNLDWIVVEEVGDDKYWMAVIRNGIPSPQYDAILDITNIKDSIMNLLMNDTFKLFSTCGEIKAIFEDMKNVEDVDLNKLTEDVKTKIAFTKLQGIPNALIYSAFGFLFVCGALYGISTFLEGADIREKAENLQKVQQQEQIMKQQKYQNDLKKYEEDKKIAKKTVIDNILLGMTSTPNYMLSNWYNTIGSLELGTHGWALDSIECYVTEMTPSSPQKSACDFKFVKGELATNRMLLEDYPDALIKGNQAVVTKEVPLNKDNLLNMKEEDIANLPTTSAWGSDMISQLQLLKTVDIEHSIAPSIDMVYTPPVKPVDPNLAQTGVLPVAEGPQSVGVAKGQINVKGNNIDLMKEVADNVQFTGVGVSKAQFKVQGLGVIAWDVTLDYFVRPDHTGGISSSASSGIENDAKELQKQQNPATIGK